MKRKLSNYLSYIVLAYWPYLLLLNLILTVLCLPSAVRLFKAINTDFVALLPEKDPNVQSLLLAKRKLDRGIRCAFVIESDDRNANIRMVENLTEKLKAHPAVARVDSRKTGHDFFDKFKLLFADLVDLKSIRDRIARKILKEKLAGLYIDLEEESGADNEFTFKDIETKYKSQYPDDVTSPYYESPDGRIFVITAESLAGDTALAASSVFFDTLVRSFSKIDTTAYHPSMKVYVSGPTKVYEYRSLLHDLSIVGIISTILLFIPLLVRFRHITPVISIFLPVILALPITFAFASRFVGQLNLVTSFLFAILGGLGIENGIHIFSRYHESRTKGVSPRDALREIFSSVMPAILTSVAAVSCTLFALMFTDFRGFSEFGFIAGVGLWMILSIYFFFLPALLILLEKFRWISFEASQQRKIKSLKILSKRKAASAVMMLGFLFGLISLILIPSLQVEFDAKKMRPHLPEAYALKEKQRLTQKRVNNPALAIIHSEEEARSLRQVVKKIATSDKDFPTLDTSRSYYDLFPTEQVQKLKVLREIEKLLQDKAIKMLDVGKRHDVDRFLKAIQNTKMITENDIPADLRYMFKGNPLVPGEIFFVNAIPAIEMDDGKNAIEFAKDVATITTDHGVFHPSNDAVIYGKILKSMLSSAPRIILLSVLVVALFVYLEFRRWVPTTLVMGAVILGVLWMLGILSLTGIPLTFFNIIIIPAVLGMSVDNAIHIVHRYHEMGPGSVGAVLRSSGRAALLASLTNASGFIGLLFCMHKGLYSMGILAAIGVAACLCSTLIFLPALLLCLERLSVKKRWV